MFSHNAAQTPYERPHMEPNEIPFNIASNAIEEEPQLSYASGFAKRTKDELLEAAKELGLKGYSKLNKAELVDAVAAACLDELAEAAYSALLYCSDDQYNTLHAVRDAGGVLKFAPHEVAKRYDLHPCEGLTAVYTWDDAVTFVIYKEVMAALENVDWMDLETNRLHVADALQAATVASTFCGLAAVDDVYALYAQWASDPIAEDQFLYAVVNAAEVRNVDFELTNIGDELYFEDLALATEADRIDDEEELKMFEGYLDHIIRCHRDVPMRTFPPELQTKDPSEWKAELPSIAKLYGLLLANAPADRDAHEWAEDITLGFAFDPLVSSNAGDQAEMLVNCGLDPKVANSPALRSVLAAMNDELPQWENNGWSNRELRELQSGKKAFYNEDGTEQKVGRNDPCPCGSGKKYKKCCGK